MSFGPTSQTSSGMNQLQSNAADTSSAAAPLIKQGTANTTSGANFFNNILNGNRQQTTATLAPDIQRIRDNIQQNLQAMSTLMPRGGGRSGTLFSLPFQANSQIQQLYSGLRPTAATQLANIGAGQTNAGSNLFSIGNSAAANLGDLGQRQQQITNSLWSNLGSGLLNLGMTPASAFSGSLFSKIF